MKTIESIEKRREEIIDEIRNISSMRRGTINEQYLKVPRKDKESSLRGPYYVLTRKENGRTVSTRVRSNELEEPRKICKTQNRQTSLVKGCSPVLVC